MVDRRQLRGDRDGILKLGASLRRRCRIAGYTERLGDEDVT
jgi:hypothetical protein